MTNETAALRGLVERAPDGELRRDMIGFAAERLIGDEGRRPVGAAMACWRSHGEKSAERLAQPNGYATGPGRPERHSGSVQPEAR